MNTNDFLVSQRHVHILVCGSTKAFVLDHFFQCALLIEACHVKGITKIFFNVFSYCVFLALTPATGESANPIRLCYLLTQLMSFY